MSPEVETPVAERDHIIRHHAGEHAAAGQLFAQQRGIADAVLQADDDGIRRRMLCDDLGHSGRVGALHRHQHDGGIGKDGWIFRQYEPVGREMPVNAVKARQPQAVRPDLANDARPCQQRHAAAPGRQHSADEAADTARPRDTDRPFRVHSTASLQRFDSRRRNGCLSKATVHAL
jgi:hypothetical protein